MHNNILKGVSPQASCEITFGSYVKNLRCVAFFACVVVCFVLFLFLSESELFLSESEFKSTFDNCLGPKGGLCEVWLLPLSPAIIDCGLRHAITAYVFSWRQGLSHYWQLAVP